MKYFETIVDAKTGEEQIRPYTQEEIDICVAEELKQVTISVKNRRNTLLTECDWAMLPDAPTDKNLWSIYRQALRDIPEQEGFPFTIVWPTKP